MLKRKRVKCLIVSSLTLFTYPDPIKYPVNKVYPKECKCKIIIGSQKGILTLSFIKKTMFCRFWLPFGYPNKNIFLSLQTKETKGKGNGKQERGKNR